MRMLVFAGTFCIAFVVTGIVTFIALTNVEKSMAQQAATFTIADESFVIDKSLPITVVKQHPQFGSKTQFLRKAKPIDSSQTNITE